MRKSSDPTAIPTPTLGDARSTPKNPRRAEFGDGDGPMWVRPELQRWSDEDYAVFLRRRRAPPRWSSCTPVAWDDRHVAPRTVDLRILPQHLDLRHRVHAVPSDTPRGRTGGGSRRMAALPRTRDAFRLGVLRRGPQRRGDTDAAVVAPHPGLCPVRRSCHRQDRRARCGRVPRRRGMIVPRRGLWELRRRPCPAP